MSPTPTAVFFAMIALSFACGKAYRMPGDAMRPTITPDDMCVTDAYTGSAGKIDRFDIIVLKLPDSEVRRAAGVEGTRQIKRVIGLPGENLEIRGNRLYINGAFVNEPYERITSETDRKKDFGPMVIPDGQYFVLGDNRPDSSDSRYYDPPTIKRSDIYSKVTEIKKGYYANR